MLKKLLWLDCRNLDEDLIMSSGALGFDNYLFTVRQYEVYKNSGMRSAAFVSGVNELEDLDTNCTVMSNNSEVLQKARANGNKSAIYDEINDYAALKRMALLGKSHDYAAVKFKDETNIPLELLIATFQESNTCLLKFISSAQEMKVVLATMEKGSEGVVVCSDAIEEIEKCCSVREDEDKGRIDLTVGKVTGIEHIGAGCRVCIDTASILKENEGMLIGSTSAGGILISSETHYLPYMQLRPFRVNAGAVHSYVWNNTQTSYLSELQSGSTVWCVDSEGNTRRVCVGRAKTEIRPLLKIEVLAGETSINVIVQDDWHIRLLGPQGAVLNASSLKKGDEVLTYCMKNARHVGINISEYLNEK